MLTSSSVVPLRQTALALALLGSACFDSDDKFRFAQDATTTGVPATTTTTDPSTSTGEPPASSSGDADVTCRDLIACVGNCAFMIDPNDPEPDLSCLVECTEHPNTDEREVYDLLRLIECLNNVCVEMMECDPVDMSTTSSGSDTGASTSSSTSSSEEEGGVGVLTPCLACIFVMISEADAAVCQEFHAECV